MEHKVALVPRLPVTPLLHELSTEPGHVYTLDDVLVLDRLVERNLFGVVIHRRIQVLVPQLSAAKGVQPVEHIFVLFGRDRVQLLVCVNSERKALGRVRLFRDRYAHLCYIDLVVGERVLLRVKGVNTERNVSINVEPTPSKIINNM